MIDFYFWTTPNGYKVLQFLEESGLEYRVIPVNINKGEQFEPEFLKISPNNKIPAIVDHNPANSDEPIAVFDSGAILLYLAEKTGQYLPVQTQQRVDVMQWLFWQMSGLGPMAGQVIHFVHSASEKVPYATERYIDETARLFSVLDKQLEGREYITGEFSIADMATYPWVAISNTIRQNLADYPNVARWAARMQARPATVRAYEKGAAAKAGIQVTQRPLEQSAA